MAMMYSGEAWRRWCCQYQGARRLRAPHRRTLSIVIQRTQSPAKERLRKAGERLCRSNRYGEYCEAECGLRGVDR